MRFNAVGKTPNACEIGGFLSQILYAGIVDFTWSGNMPHAQKLHFGDVLI